MSAVERERRGHVEILTINRPEARNAINGEVSRGHVRRVRRARRPTTGAGSSIVTGAGDKAFSAGMDLKAFASGEGGAIMGGVRGLRRDHPARSSPSRSSPPSTAPCLAGGCEIMLSCDLVVAADHATFGIPEVKRGLVAGAGGLFRLPKRLPLAIALELGAHRRIRSTRRVPCSSGSINRVVPADAAHGRGLALAGEIAENAPLAVRWTKHVMVRGRRRLGGRGLEAQRRGRRRGVLLGRRHGGPGRLRREAQAQLAGEVGAPVDVGHGGLAPALDGIRLSLHVLAAAVWVGGQFTMAGLVPTAREPRARARPGPWPAPSPGCSGPPTPCSWSPASGTSRPSAPASPAAWQVVLGVKIAVVALAGLAAWLHTRATTKAGLAAWGAVAVAVVDRRPGHGGLPGRLRPSAAAVRRCRPANSGLTLSRRSRYRRAPKKGRRPCTHARRDLRESTGSSSCRGRPPSSSAAPRSPSWPGRSARPSREFKKGLAEGAKSRRRQTTTPSDRRRRLGQTATAGRPRA